MEWLIENWYVIVGLLALIICMGVGIFNFFRLSTDDKIANIKEWLKYAVAMAEKELGSGTGQLKLHYVYDLAIEKFPWIANVVSFATFSEWVDESLLWLERQLATNKDAKNYIKGE